VAQVVVWDLPKRGRHHPADRPFGSAASLLEHSDGWATKRARFMTLETIGSVSDNPVVSLPALAGRRGG